MLEKLLKRLFSEIFFPNLIKSCKTIFLWLFECKYKTLKQIMIQVNCESYFHTMDKRIFTAKHWFGRPRQFQKITTLCWNSWDIGSAEYLNKRLTLSFFLFLNFVQPSDICTYRNIFFVISGIWIYIFWKKNYFFFFHCIFLFKRLIICSEHNIHFCYQAQTGKGQVLFKSTIPYQCL